MKVRVTERSEVEKYYQNADVAEQYITKRFTDPLNVIEHRRQVELLNKIIQDKKCTAFLEFAPGPARVTAELNVENGTSIESSPSMIKIAQQRMKEKRKKWNFVLGDVFKLHNDKQLHKKYDLVFCFRFLLHFKYAERKAIYRQAHTALKENGHLVFEVMNKNTVLPLRRILGKRRYFVYDKLYNKKEFIREMEENGFQVVALHPVLTHFWLQTVLSRPLKMLGMRTMAEKSIALLEKFLSTQPYEWIAVCRKQQRTSELQKTSETRKE